MNGTRLDDRLIRVDWDAGFIEGRQYGRGKTGGQVRDEYRTDYDAGRGGYSKLLQQKIAPKTDNRKFYGILHFTLGFIRNIQCKLKIL